jgi:hypothetical protein
MLLNGEHACFVYMKSWVQKYARRQDAMPEVYSSSLWSLQAYFEVSLLEYETFLSS